MLQLRTKVASLVMTVVMAGCAGTPPSTPAPSASQAAVVTPQPTAQATPTPITPAPVTPAPETPGPVIPGATPRTTCEGGAPATPIAADAIVCVIAGPLRLRSRPSTADDSLKFEPLLQTGELLFVIDGPTTGSGYPWYLVQQTPGSLESADGWVAAASRAGTPWLGTATVDCPADPSLQDLAVMDAVQRIHCYHAREFTFTATVEGGPMCGDGVVLKSPTWMAGCFSTMWWGGPPKSLIVAIPPNLADAAGAFEPDEPFEATITAHMDDPAALTCVPNEGFEADYQLLNPGTILACRAMFVATSFVRISP